MTDIERQPRIAVVVFPGSNDDRDAQLALTRLGADAVRVWHTQNELPRETAGVVLPGGFSYGDYLRAGAIARFSPIMQAVERFAKEGGLVLGICNGFQVLTEARLLPGNCCARTRHSTSSAVTLLSALSSRIRVSPRGATTARR